MTPFKLRTLESAPEEAKPLLQRKLIQFGFVPHLAGQLAVSPVVLKAYSDLFDSFANTSLSPGERFVVLLAAGVESNDAFGVAQWTHLARESRYLSFELIEVLRKGDVLGNPKLDALANLTRQIVRRGGRAQGVPLAAFLAAGYLTQQALDVLLGVTLATMGAYASKLLQTPLNGELQPDWWIAPLRDPLEDAPKPDACATPIRNRAA